VLVNFKHALFREEEVEKGEEFSEVVLKGGAGQKKRVLEVKPSDGLGDLRLLVLDDVSLVEHHVAPVHAVR